MRRAKVSRPSKALLCTAETFPGFDELVPVVYQRFDHEDWSFVSTIAFPAADDDVVDFFLENES
jgi:hypothetical protein